MDAVLDDTFSALADPTRRAILQRLTRGPASVGELAAPFDISLPAISRHLKVLERAALIIRHKDAQRRRIELNPKSLQAATEWLGEYRTYWEESLDRLADYLELEEDHDGHTHAKR